MLNRALAGLGRLDDATQSLIRNKILGLPSDGRRLPDGAKARAVREMLGNVHRARPTADSSRSHHVAPTAYQFTNDREGLAAMLATRGLQAGGLTAAGLGLASLINAFGGPADQPEQGQLNVDRSVDNNGLANDLGLMSAAALATSGAFLLEDEFNKPPVESHEDMIARLKLLGQI